MILAILFIAIFAQVTAQVLSLFHIISYLPILLAVWVLKNNFLVPLLRIIADGLIVSILLFIFFTCLLTQADYCERKYWAYSCILVYLHYLYHPFG